VLFDLFHDLLNPIQMEISHNFTDFGIVFPSFCIFWVDSKLVFEMPSYSFGELVDQALVAEDVVNRDAGLSCILELCLDSLVCCMIHIAANIHNEWTFAS